MSFRDRMLEEDRNWAFEEERRRERESQHAPAYGSLEELARRHPILAAACEMAGEPVSGPPPIGPDPILLMVVQVPHGTEGAVVKAVARQAAKRSVTVMLWTRRPRRRHRRAMKLLFGRKLGRRLTG